MEIEVPELLQKMFLINEPKCGYLVLVRHGESVRQSKGEAHAGDSYDTPLSERGQAQAQKVAERLSERTVHAVYSSPLKRARETAGVIGDALKLDVNERDDLREVEIDRDGAESVTAGSEELLQRDVLQEAMEAFKWDHLGFTETSDSLRTRTWNCVKDIRERHPAETAVIVAHTGVINAYVAECLNMESDFITLPAHTGISTIRSFDDHQVVVTINDYSHLR